MLVKTPNNMDQGRLAIRDYRIRWRHWVHFHVQFQKNTTENVLDRE